MTKTKILLLTLFVVFSTACQSNNGTTEEAKAKKIKTLIIDGQNNHVMWPKITFMMKVHLEETEMFEVDVKRSAYTWKGEEYIKEFPLKGVGKTEALEKPKSDPNYQPNFSKYDLVICNFGWRAAAWPKATEKALEQFVSGGGGLVVIHAADNSFPQWLEYNKMIGLGGWGDRTEKDGPYVYYNNDGDLVKDTSKGNAGAHGPQHEFVVKIRNADHPITKGMPTEWLHTKDELYAKLRGPAENMEILGTSYASPDQKGTDRHEPMLMTLTYGKGKVFHTPMGHADYSVECVGFITCLLRGAEWAATGKVTTEIPSDFPTASKSSARKFVKP